MSSSRSISKIPYSSLPVEIHCYLAQESYNQAIWEAKCSAEDQHRIIAEYSLAATVNHPSAFVTAPAHHVMEEMKEETHDLLNGDVEGIIEQFFVGDIGSGKNYSPSTVGNTLFFEKKIPVLALLQHVIRGEQAEAEAMLKKNPRLLLEKGTVIDYSGRTIEGTAFQLALGAEDVGIQDGEECMAEMIKRYFKLLPSSETEMTKQYQEQFPDGWETKEQEKATNDLLALHKVLNAIREAKPANESYAACETACEPALVEFRQYLEAQAKAGVIKTGKHFNVQLLVEAFKLYDENYRSFGDSWYSPKNMLCWRKICGFIQRQLPTCYAQAFCQGIYYITEDKEKLKRSLEYRHDKGYFYFPLGASSSGLGYDYAAGGPGAATHDAGNLGACFYKSYVEQKQQTCRAYTASQTTAGVSVCNLLK